MQPADNSTMRLLHYWWPVALGWSLTVVVQRATGRTANPFGTAALLSGIVAAYSLDRVIDPSSGPGNGSWVRRALAVTGLLAAVVCGVAMWHLPRRTAALIPVLGAAALLYAPLKQLPVTKTVALPLVWIWASMALPFNDGWWLGWALLLRPVALPLLLLISAGCVLCDLKDEAADRSAGVRSLPVLLGRAATVRVAAALTIASAALALLEHRPGIALSAATLGALTAWPALLATDAAGPLLVDVILTLPGILISARVV